MIKYLIFLSIIFSIQAVRHIHNFTNRVAMSISVDGEEKGEFYIGLWRPTLEKAVDNFISLCVGYSEKNYTSGDVFHIKNKHFYTIVENQYMKAGDISPNYNWGGNQTMYGEGQEGLWRCENSKYGYEPGILVHHQSDNMDVGSEFFIWLAKKHLHPAYNSFGLVYKNLELVKYITKTAGTSNGIPKREVKVSNCRIVNEK